MAVTDDAIKIARAGLDFKKSIDRFRGDYVRRRAAFLHAANATWNAAKIAAQIRAEMAVVDTYLAGKKPILDNADPATPFHLDLKVQSALIMLSATNGTWGNLFFEGLLKDLLRVRADAVSQIVWRAVGIHSGALWKSLGPPPELHKAALDELLDRRLRMVEHMHCNVNSAGFGKFGRPWVVQGPTGPWMDGYRARSFEYPDVAPGTAFAPFETQMTDWSFSREGSRITSVSFNPPNAPLPVRVPNSVTQSWRVDASKDWINYRPTATAPADVIVEMFTARGDFWDRSWLFCDQVGSLVNLEALWFALRRRTGNDTAFNTVMNRADYVKLGPVVRKAQHDIDILMADDTDPFFENLAVEFDDLQVGDFVQFWNSRIYAMLPPYGGPWTSEFSLVMQIEIDGAKGNVLKPLSGGPQIWLAGHGVHTMPYDSMATETTDHLKSRFVKARELVANTASDVVFDGNNVYVRWSPYEDFDPPGAWWVQISKGKWHDHWGYATLADAQDAIPRTVIPETGGTGYHPPPNTEAIYFPLFEPAVAQSGADGDSWRAYLRQRKANPQFRPASTKLKELSIDGRLAQGLFYRGSKAKVPVVRPRVRP